MVQGALAVGKSIWTEDYLQVCVPQSFVSKYETEERRLDVIDLRHVAEDLGATGKAVVARLP